MEKLTPNLSGSSSKPDARVRRRFPRFPLDVRLSVHVLREGEKISMWGRSNELGCDGIGATLTAGIDPGEVVSMELSLPLTAVPLRIRAIVRYRDGLRHGFEFLALSGDQRDAVARVCEMLETGT
jgi:PilZ domain-containing protein